VRVTGNYKKHGRCTEAKDIIDHEQRQKQTDAISNSRPKNKNAVRSAVIRKKTDKLHKKLAAMKIRLAALRPQAREKSSVSVAFFPLCEEWYII
jgi:hypothetical protein